MENGMNLIAAGLCCVSATVATLSCRSSGTVLVELTRGDTHLIVTVADNGPGIPPELLERVFEPLFTTKPRGSGLGLAISAGIAQAHGARLRAVNRPTGGASFTVELPIATVTSPVTA